MNRPVTQLAGHALRVWVNWNMIVPGSHGDPKRLYASIQVANLGRRPLFVSHVHFELPKRITTVKLVLPDGIKGKSLNEGSPPESFLMDQYAIGEDHPLYAKHWKLIRAVVIDAGGTHYKSKRPTAKDAPEFKPSMSV